MLHRALAKGAKQEIEAFLWRQPPHGHDRTAGTCRSESAISSIKRRLYGVGNHVNSLLSY